MNSSPVQTYPAGNAHHRQLAMTTGLYERRIRRRSVALALFASQLLTAAVGWIAACNYLESILLTGPLLAGIGLAMAVSVRPFGAWFPLLFAVSAPVVTALGAFVIAIFHLGPDAAYRPTVALLSVYVVLLVVASPFVFRELRQRTPSSLPVKMWRYSLKSLLVAMTVFAICTVLVTTVVKSLADFPVAFGAFGSIAMIVTFLVAWRFYTYRQQVVYPPNSTSPWSADEWLERNLFSGFFSAKNDARCSFCGRCHSEAGPFAEGRNGSLICSHCLVKCAELIAASKASAADDVSSGAKAQTL